MFDILKQLVLMLLALVCVAVTVVSVANTEWYQGVSLRNQLQDDYDAVPRVVRDVDGCQVYSFKDAGNRHYFTRCPKERVQTDSTIRQGKHTHISSIVTEDK